MNSILLPDFKAISLQDRINFNSYLKRFQPDISEFTFTNLFMWRNHYQFRWRQYKNQLILVSAKVKPPKILSVFPPLGDALKVSLEFLIDISKKLKLNLEMVRFPEKDLDLLKSTGIQHEIIEERGNWDYVYDRNDLITLPGKPYANFRKKLNRFKRQFQWSYEELSESLIENILNMQDEWCGIRACYDDENLNEENLGIHEIFSNWKDLKFDGGVIKVDEKIVAYTLAELLNKDTIVVHVEKANPAFNGAYQTVAQQFYEKLDSSIKFINREQDLGKINLRKAKEHYHPIRYVKKYKIKF
ncbi:DUF2156 domain-containing protein [Promethearchaeum syntrophicum]|uniref:DUF2156 domain-containing protein n=1 Tax=Promethearchaeum syntrophicum TaxID=2594042 RepID=A0A5B9DER4_9ARCH|nr:phosphatidylglycerol lysyltransferase domain-containing protein [Candidatus Prometheoarchaeum syntrophicum]QEE17273.1 hypothetical protein DSAG12_03105 [Candidatus Prometheoarchaeum syntrophicum]